jgi:Uma2 family endonuclease
MTIQPDADADDYPYYEETVTESSWHYKAIEYLHSALGNRYADRQDVFVGANNFIYWEKGKKSRKQAPDVYVCFGARNIDRRSFKTWEEGGLAPQVVFEITSDSSRFTDQGTKKAVYEALGIEEYYLFDPLREYIPKGLLAFFNKRGSLQPVTGKRIFSPRLKLDLRAEGRLLRLFQPGSSQRILTYSEAEAARQAAEARVERLQADIAELRRKIDP